MEERASHPVFGSIVGQWIGIAAIASAVVVTLGAMLGIFNGGYQLSFIDGEFTASQRLSIALEQLALLPPLLIVVALLVERSRRLPLIALGIFVAGRLVDAGVAFTALGSRL